MAFDADAYLATLEAPAVTINETTYTGRILSIEEFAPFAGKLEGLSNASNAEFMEFATRYLRTVFPYQLSMRWKGDPVKDLLKSPALVPTLVNFLALQVQALNGKPLNLMSGTDSQPLP